MSRSHSSTNIECPSCQKLISEGQPQPWCPECQELFSERFLQIHPEIYRPTPGSHADTEGINDDYSNKILGYALLTIGIALIVIPFFWHPNASVEFTLLKLSPYYLASLTAAWYYLHHKRPKSPSHRPPA